MITLLSAVPEEGKFFARQLKEKSLIGGKPVRRGVIYGKDVIHITSGLGKTNAAHAATILLEKFSPDILIVLGVGGAYPSSGLAVGDIAVAEKEVYGDEGVMMKGNFHGTEFMGIPLLKKGRKKYFNEFPLKRMLVERAVEAAQRIRHHSEGISRVGIGTFVTVSTCTGAREKALELERTFSALCENMEGAAVVHVCATYDLPVIELRGISNIVGDRDKNKWNVRLASARCQAAIKELLKDLCQIVPSGTES